jgi:hypothetical protein
MAGERGSATDVARAAGAADAGKLTAADWLGVALSRLPECLADRRSLARLQALAHRLPDAGPMVLETRLRRTGTRHRAVDLSLHVTSPAHAAALCELGESERPAAGFGWPRFLRAWAMRPDWRTRVPSLWLEFDLGRLPAMPALPAALPAPVICARLADGVDAAWVAATLLPAMHGAALTAVQCRLLERCWRETPAAGRPLYVFSLASRGAGRVRVEIAGGLDLPALACLLARLRAPAAARRVARLQPLLAEADRLHLSCDLGDLDEPLAPRVGVEVSFPRQPRNDPRWDRLLGRLVAAGLCSPAARDAALAWPGQDSLWTAPERWPGAPGAARRRCARTLSHLKLVCDRRRPTTAKLYLGLAVLGPTCEPVPPAG